MGFLERFSGSFGHPSIERYRCVECQERFDNDHGTCPKCGGEVDRDAVPAALRWGEMW